MAESTFNKIRRAANTRQQGRSRRERQGADHTADKGDKLAPPHMLPRAETCRPYLGSSGRATRTAVSGLGSWAGGSTVRTKKGVTRLAPAGLVTPPRGWWSRAPTRWMVAAVMNSGEASALRWRLSSH